MKFFHLRFGFDDEGGRYYDPRGGLTFAYQITDTGVKVGACICSDQDNYCKRIGRDISIGRMQYDFLFSEFPEIVGITPRDIVESLKIQFCDTDGFIFPDHYNEFRFGDTTLYLSRCSVEKEVEHA